MPVPGPRLAATASPLHTHLLKGPGNVDDHGMLRDAEGRLEEAQVVQAYIAERDIAWVRFGIIVFNAVLYLVALPHDPARHTLALWVALGAVVYGFAVVAARPYEHLHILRTSAYTLATDSGLIAVWLYATGGLASPFYPLWAVSIVAAVFRFGPGIVALAAGVYMAADVGMLFASGHVLRQHVGEITIRAGYILITGVLGALVGHRWQASVRARMKLAREMQDKDMVLAEAERVRALTDATSEGIAIHRQGLIMEVNSAFANLFGRQPTELIGMDVRDLVHDDSAGLLEDRLANPADSGYELWVRRGEERIRVAVQGRPIRFRGQAARVVAVRDITERFHAERDRALAHERQVEIDRLRQIDDFRTQFINTAAHELNTPLTPIKLQFAALRDEWVGRPRAIDLLERNLDRLSSLVHDMLDVARLQSGRLRMDVRAVDLVPALNDIIDTFEATALQQEVQLELLAPGRLTAYVDPDRVSQIITNLVSNGLKFTPKGGSVTVVARDAPGAVRIEVADTGKGVPSDQVELLFQPFGQVQADPQVPGTGLGLYICKTLAETMGGRIGVETEGEGAGARFWVELPVSQAAAEAGQARQALRQATVPVPPKAPERAPASS